MSVSIKKIYSEFKEKYSIELLAGAQGIDQDVSWIHLSEDWQASSFLHGNELIITTGILSDSPDWLLQFCRALLVNKACGIIVSTGYYITSISDEVLAYCNANAFPIFEIPRAANLIDVSRQMCNMIQEDEKNEFVISTAFLNAIMYPDAKQIYSSILTQHDFKQDAPYCVLCIKTENRRSFSTSLLNKYNGVISRFNHIFNLILNDEEIIAVFYQVDQPEIKKIISSLIRYSIQIEKMQIYIGIGPEVRSLYKLNYSYTKAHICCSLALKQKQNIVDFNNQGIKSLLLSVNDTELYENYLKDTLYPIQAYDKTHNTNFLDVLRLYIETDCNIQAIANTLYTHRNTINYRVRKIKDILGCQLSTMEEKVRFQIAFYIMDIINSNNEPAPPKSIAPPDPNMFFFQ